jgi:hypothetical protein
MINPIANRLIDFSPTLISPPFTGKWLVQYSSTAETCREFYRIVPFADQSILLVELTELSGPGLY